MVNNQKNKIEIVRVLREFGRLPTARISAIAGINYNTAKLILLELVAEKIIISEKAGELAIYWELIKDE